MTRMKKPAAAAAACLVMTTLLATAHAADSATITNAQDGWAAFTKCAAIKDNKARHTCFDDVSRAAGYLSSAGTSEHKEFGLRPAPSPAAQVKADNQLQVTVASVAKTRDGKLTFTMTDGAVWRQVEGETLLDAPTQGQTMTIEKTSLGGFFCRPTKYLAFRCRRIR
jgi:hypothetical protein